MKVTLCEQLLWLYILSEAMSEVILGNDELKLSTEFISNQNGTDKINSISENPTKIEVSFTFFRVSDIPHWKY